MELNRKRAQALAAKIKTRHGASLPLNLTRSEVARHNAEGDCFVVVKGNIYDVTDYLDMHPGGSDLLLRDAGADATADFEAGFHSQIARMILEHLKVGQLKGEKGPSSLSPLTGGMLAPMGRGSPMTGRLGASPSPFAAPSPKPAATTPPMDPVKWQTFKLIQTRKATHDTVVLRFALPSSTQTLKFPPGHHIFVGRKGEDGTVVSRPYTPILTEPGHFDLLVKVYEGGLISPYLFKLLPGETMLMRGPAGIYRLEKDLKEKETLFLVAGGTGITVMLPLLKAILQDNSPKTVGSSNEGDAGVALTIGVPQLSTGVTVTAPSEPELQPSNQIAGLNVNSLKLVLLMCQKTKADILCQKEINTLLSANLDTLTVHYHYSREEVEPGKLRGILGEDYLKNVAPEGGSKVRALVCGPVAFNKHVSGLLGGCGYEENDIVLFE
eukprot:comp18952_c0_seq1/m.21212 comp18952_c0_seq1/g.21212  ORF comp18952_c0_seq1/g.21212 comp18952_c0_seq1/m.21212 type:complete len:439 (-) comp18952_c0_seq1:356-1672(-)